MQRKLTALIVEDEANAAALLHQLLQDTMQFSDIGIANSTSEAFEMLKHAEPDILFLDVKMPGQDGISFLKELRRKAISSEVVFVTAYDQFALQAIKNQAFDYLLKPVDRKELMDCIGQYRSRKHALRQSPAVIRASGEENGKLRINTRTGYLLIDPLNILYCKADGNYTCIDLGDKQHLCSIQLGVLEKMLPKSGFFRLGRSIILNFDFISMVDRKLNTVTMERDPKSYSLTISKSQLKELETKQAR